MEFRVLGPSEVVVDGAPLRLGGPKQRAVLASLALSPSEVVSADAIADVVWGDSPPKSWHWDAMPG